uniref:Uncharacterized protein n=1 Tax=Euplotes crassus TaxID=5936 RepID=A0A7S3NUJ1_EUPCR|mmetsp:Transcript_3302/g.3033  ORF Transcript_3302/g.3033 Transcript_3302/m.3033 type:complete len:148 (+) Transcript_3302:325-768(+)
MKFEGQINIKGQGKFIYDKQKSLLELLKQVSDGKGGDEFFPNTPFGLNNNQFPEHTQKEIDEYRAKLASKQEDFLSKNPHLFSDLGVLTTKEIQESLDAMKDAIGNSVNLKNEEMNYNYSNQFESVKDLLSPTQAGVNQCEILNNPN